MDLNIPSVGNLFRAASWATDNICKYNNSIAEIQLKNPGYNYTKSFPRSHCYLWILHDLPPYFQAGCADPVSFTISNSMLSGSSSKNGQGPEPEFSIHVTPVNDNSRGAVEHFEFHLDSWQMSGIKSRLTIMQKDNFKLQSNWIPCHAGISTYSFPVGEYENIGDEQSEDENIVNEDNDNPDDSLIRESPKFSMLYNNYSIPIFLRFRKVKLVLVEFADMDVELKKIYDSAPYKGKPLFVKFFEENSDVEIVIWDNEKKEIVRKFMAHMEVLEACSPVFRAMLGTEMKEKQLAQIEMKDFGPEIIEELLKYLYTGKLIYHLRAQIVVDLFKCGDKYQIKQLTKDCLDYIGDNIPKFGFCRIFELFQLYEGRIFTLQDKVLGFYIKNESSLYESKDFQRAMELFPLEYVNLQKAKHCRGEFTTA